MTVLTCYSPPDPVTDPAMLTTNPTSHLLLVPNTDTPLIQPISTDYPHLVSTHHLHTTHTTAYLLPDDAATSNHEPPVAHAYLTQTTPAIATHPALDSSTARPQLAHTLTTRIQYLSYPACYRHHCP